jgi:glucuronyl/N-acetylglucosaminyl transferase EXT2
MILTKAGFLHKNYLTLYSDETQHPKEILQYVDDHKNCEDIAMSFFVSSITQGKLPLLADFWAMQAMIKLTSPHKISDTSNHKAIRDSCVDSFADILGLKNSSFQPGTIMDSKTRNWFGVGVERDYWTLGEDFPLRRRQLYEMLQSWEQNKIIRKKVLELEMETAQEAITKGLLDQ